MTSDPSSFDVYYDGDKNHYTIKKREERTSIIFGPPITQEDLCGGGAGIDKIPVGESTHLLSVVTGGSSDLFSPSASRIIFSVDPGVPTSDANLQQQAASDTGTATEATNTEEEVDKGIFCSLTCSRNAYLCSFVHLSSPNLSQSSSLRLRFIFSILREVLEYSLIVNRVF